PTTVATTRIAPIFGIIEVVVAPVRPPEIRLFLFLIMTHHLHRAPVMCCRIALGARIAVGDSKRAERYRQNCSYSDPEIVISFSGQLATDSLRAYFIHGFPSCRI